MLTMLLWSVAYGKAPVANVGQGDFNLSSQAEIDAFHSTEVNGNLSISGWDISDLSSLSSLREVSGKLTIENNPILETVEGVDAMESVGLGLYLKHNGALTDLSALSTSKVVRDLVIENCLISNFVSAAAGHSISWLRAFFVFNLEC